MAFWNKIKDNCSDHIKVFVQDDYKYDLSEIRKILYKKFLVSIADLSEVLQDGPED